MQRALLTGVTGFVGSHLARHLLGLGVEVHAVVRPGARVDRVPDLAERVVLHVDDGSPTGLHGVVERAAPEACIHLATRFVAEHGPGDVGDLVADNVGFPARLADALATAGVRQFVNTGTAWQHVEGAAYRPKNLYAATKQAFEDVLRYYGDHDRLEVVTVKLYDTYGPQDHRGKLVDALLRAVRTGEPAAMSSGRQIIDLVHIDDVVRALLLAIAPGRSGSFALSSGRPCTVRSLVDVLGTVAGRPVPVEWGRRPDRAEEMLTHWDAGAPLPGWAPEVALEDGLRALLEGRPSSLA